MTQPNLTTRRISSQDLADTLLDEAAATFGFRIALSTHAEWARCNASACRPCTASLSGKSLRVERSLFKAWMAAAGVDAEEYSQSTAFRDAFTRGYDRLCKHYHGYCAQGIPKRWIPVRMSDLGRER